MKLEQKVIKVLNYTKNEDLKNQVAELEINKNLQFDVTQVNTRTEINEKLNNQEFDIVLLGLSILISVGFEEINFLKKQFSNVPIIIVSSEDSPVLVREAINYGSDDFILFPSSIQNIEKKILNLLQNAQKSKKIIQSPEFATFIGNSPKMIELKEQILRYAKTQSPILILGEKGTGKSFLAEIVHNLSKRQGLFVTENAANFSESLVNAQLFGTKVGSFTGAVNSKGLFQQAQNGTLFLDEIAETPINVQGNFLRAIEEKRIRPVGGTEISCDVRIITATNKDLQSCIQNKTFRSDLYDRISTLKVTVPPLRERISDIPLLTENFLHAKNCKISNLAMNKLQSYCWNGNVRELKNVLERACCLCENSFILPTDILFD